MKLEQQQNIEKNLRTLLQKNVSVPYVLKKLENAKIRYGVYSGSHVAALVNNRDINDVDIVIHDDDIALLRSTFPFAKTEDKGIGVFLYVAGDTIECVSCGDLAKDGKLYPFRLSELAASKLTTYEVDGYKINLVNPADTLMVKAILQRGSEQGKHDLEDIEAVLSEIELDSEYLTARLRESKAVDVTHDIWKKFGVM